MTFLSVSFSHARSSSHIAISDMAINYAPTMTTLRWASIVSFPPLLFTHEKQQLHCNEQWMDNNTIPFLNLLFYIRNRGCTPTNSRWMTDNTQVSNVTPPPLLLTQEPGAMPRHPQTTDAQPWRMMDSNNGLPLPFLSPGVVNTYTDVVNTYTHILPHLRPFSSPYSIMNILAVLMCSWCILYIQCVCNTVHDAMWWICFHLFLWM